MVFEGGIGVHIFVISLGMQSMYAGCVVPTDGSGLLRNSIISSICDGLDCPPVPCGGVL